MTALSSTTPMTITAFVHSLGTRDAVLDALDDERHLKCDARVQPLADADSILPDDHHADLLLVEVDLEDDGQMRALEALAATRSSSLPIIALTGETSLAGMRRLMHIGIADVVLLPLRRGDLLAAVASAQRGGGGRAARGRSDQRGAVISVLKACGGSGATTVAVHVASAMARQSGQGRRVGLVDLDLQFGSAGLYLDLDPHLTILDILNASERLDSELVSSAATRHRSGVQVLPAASDLAPLDLVTPATAERLVGCARKAWTHTVFELPHVWTAWTRAVLACSDAVLLVTQMTVPGIHHAARQMDTLRQEGLGHLPLVLAINRYEKGLFKDSVVKQAEQALGVTLEHFIPSDFKSVSQAIDTGAPLNETRQGRKTLKRLEELAESLTKAAETARQASA